MCITISTKPEIFYGEIEMEGVSKIILSVYPAFVEIVVIVVEVTFAVVEVVVGVVSPAVQLLVHLVSVSLHIGFLLFCFLVLLVFIFFIATCSSRLVAAFGVGSLSLFKLVESPRNILRCSCRSLLPLSGLSCSLRPQLLGEPAPAEVQRGILGNGESVQVSLHGVFALLCRGGWRRSYVELRGPHLGLQLFPHGKKVILLGVLDQWRNPLRPRRELGRRRENGLRSVTSSDPQ